MKRHVLTIVLASMLLPTAALCQEREALEHAERQLELRNMELKQAKIEGEAKFHEEMQKLELEQRRLQIERAHRQLGHHKNGLCGILVLCLIVGFIVRILAATWVYKDMRQRNAGSGIWIVIVLLAGLCGVLVYAIVRLGDITNSRRPRR